MHYHSTHRSPKRATTIRVLVRTNPTESATLTIPEAAELLGISRNSAYQHAASDGHLAGVPVISVGRRLVIPAAIFREVLGLPVGSADDAAEN